MDNNQFLVNAFVQITYHASFNIGDIYYFGDLELKSRSIKYSWSR